MKKFLPVLFAIFVLTLFTTPVFAVKSNGAQFVNWNLSADVMPVPPYGTQDIPGSDIGSKLIVNQPNGKTQVTITGAMNNLNPNATYKVFLSKAYIPKTSWPGLFTSTTIPIFTFVTDEFGAGSWHLNLTDANFSGPGTFNLSVWVNTITPYNATILISDVFSVVVD